MFHSIMIVTAYLLAGYFYCIKKEKLDAIFFIGISIFLVVIKL